MARGAVRVAVGLGSNRGDRLANLEVGWRGLARSLANPRCSAIYETEPVHVTAQRRFLNACVVGFTHLGPEALLAHLQCLEQKAGRRPGSRYGPRELDLDLLLYGDSIVDTDDLRIPHPRLVERAFVLVPLAEVAGDWVHPESGSSMAVLRSRVAQAEVWRYVGTDEGEGQAPKGRIESP